MGWRMIYVLILSKLVPLKSKGSGLEFKSELLVFQPVFHVTGVKIVLLREIFKMN